MYSGSQRPKSVFRYADITFGGGMDTGALWIDSGAELTLDHVSFSSNGPCDVTVRGSLEAQGASQYVPCP